jgi:hypothetical protein
MELASGVAGKASWITPGGDLDGHRKVAFVVGR